MTSFSLFNHPQLPITRRLSKDEINDLPLIRWQGPIHLVETEQEAEQVRPLLSKTSLLGFDTETRPSFKKGRRNRPALLQLATGSDVVLFRLSGKKLPKTVIDLLTDRKIIKTGVAVGDDLKSLQRITPFLPQGFSDLSSLSKVCGISHHGLRGMAAAVLGGRISKTARLSNWASPSLTPAQINYAATDAWVGREIYLHLVPAEKISTTNRYKDGGVDS